MDDHTVDHGIGPPTTGDPTGWRTDRAASDGREHGGVRRAVVQVVRLYNSGETREFTSASGTFVRCTALAGLQLTQTHG